MIRFDGQVAIVTGAGRGMGRVTALKLAERGAKVVVNDYGGDMSAVSPGEVTVAQEVVDEIVAAGGEAVADGNSVGTGEAATSIVSKAIETWGRVDVLVNNAGGGVGGPLDEFDDDVIEGVLKTNLVGPYMLMRRCWPYFRQQRYGRVVNVLSSAVLGFDQVAPYAAGKSGLIGLTTSAAIEGAAFDTLVNGILPAGKSRMSEADVPEVAEWMAKYFAPEYVAETTVFLASSANQDVSGQFFSTGAGRAARVAFSNAEGFDHPEFTADLLAENIATAQDMQGSVVVTSSWEDNMRFFGVAPWTGDPALGAVGVEK